MDKNYTSSALDLFFPEKAPPVFKEPEKPGTEELAIEASRLSYFPFENSAEVKQALELALRHVGFHEFEYFGATAPGAGAITLPGSAFALPNLVAGFAKRSVESLLSIPDKVSDALDDTAKALHPNFTLFENPTDTQAFGAFKHDGDGGLILLAFRGPQANTFKDFLLDVQALQVKAQGWDGLLHHGFARAASAIWPKIERWLARHPNAKLLLTGHSLGAAVATLIAVRANRPEKTTLITLGSPRVGDPVFAASFAAAKIWSTRIVDCADVVTRVPPSKTGDIEYEHVGVPIYINKDGRISEAPTNDNNTSDPLDLKDIRARLAALKLELQVGLPTDLTDHAAFNYLRAYRTKPPFQS